MMKKIRVALATVIFIAAVLLFAGFSRPAVPWLGWVARIQFIPALLAANFAIVAVILLLTFLFGRVYCSVICPLGIFQDIVSFFGGRAKKNRFAFRKNNKWLRYAILAAFAVMMFLGLTAWIAVIEPYGIFGRAFSNGSGYIVAVTAITIVLIAVLAWFGGRLWCNNICPVGTLLGVISKYSLFKPTIDTSKCTGCGLCAKNCKSSCIDPATHTIDTSRCVVCMDCLGKCNAGAITYSFRGLKPSSKGASGKCGCECGEQPDESKRGFLAATALLATSAALNAQSVQLDGGLAAIEGKKEPNREVPLKPAGSRSLKHFTRNCVACQLCVTKCPEKVLRPSKSLETLMQPEMSFGEGYCRAKCNVCSQVCPAKAIEPVTVAEKSSIRIGHAVWIPENCVVNRDRVNCGKCASVCLSGAIAMVAGDGGKRIPAINTEICIGCGSCEYHCPSRPYSAIYVVGHEVHSER